ncbi:MAG: vitamin K epoxide reductase family protein [Candidatus Pacebacteria bacterium]|nr:vitamin K epoxide reductase family protein [Candidatus Paceibacterota bacterium]
MSLAPFYLVSLTLIGIADTLYLAYNKFMNTTPSCLLKGCDAVLAHPLSNFLGVPLSYWGLVYYVYMFGLVALLVMDPRSKALRIGTLVYAGVGLLCSAAFIYIQATIIGAFCQYCLLSAAVTLGLFSLALWHYKKTK